MGQYTLLFTFYCSFSKQFFQKKNSEPYIPRFLLFITFLNNNFSKKSLKLLQAILLALQEPHFWCVQSRECVEILTFFALFVENSRLLKRVPQGRTLGWGRMGPAPHLPPLYWFTPAPIWGWGEIFCRQRRRRWNIDVFWKWSLFSKRYICKWKS